MRRLGSVRVRTTIGASVVVGLALLVGAFALIGGLRRTLTNHVDTTAELRAEDVIAELATKRDLGTLQVDEDEESAVQVVEPDGRVRDATSNVDGRPPLVALDTNDAVTIDLLLDGESGRFRVVAESTEPPVEDLTVLVARSLESVDEAEHTVTTRLAIGIPLLVLLVAGTTWVVTGRALRPVDAIREEVASISDGQLDRRVPEPRVDDEIARLARTMNEMLARLEAARSRQQRFVSDASHELRSPLTTVRHGLELQVADPEHADVRPINEGLLAECLRMQGLVDDLLLLARSEEVAGPSAREPVDLDDIVLDEAARLRGRAHVQVDSGRVSAGQVRGDVGQLGRMVRNLADNAERHARSAVGFELTSWDGQVVLVVRDDGPGVPASDRTRVFERFTRLDEARARGSGGAGLGLAIVAQVVGAHQGTVVVDDAPGGGARFTVTLPLAQG